MGLDFLATVRYVSVMEFEYLLVDSHSGAWRSLSSAATPNSEKRALFSSHPGERWEIYKIKVPGERIKENQGKACAAGPHYLYQDLTSH